MQSRRLVKISKMSTLKETYQKKIVPELVKELSLTNPLAAPNIRKVVLNIGVGKDRDNQAYIQEVTQDLATITGQLPYHRPCRLSIAGFKVRQRALVGLSVTLRGERMWSFLERLLNVALPRTRDFQGLSEKAFDGHGNYSLGILEHTIFPEIDASKSNFNKSFQVTIVTSAGDDEKAFVLLDKLGMPFKSRKGVK